jgi:hypothetical protein
VPVIGQQDEFELKYMARLRAMLVEHGIPIDYAVDRVAIDTGLHLFASSPTGRRATHARVWFQAKGKRAATLPLASFRSASTIPVSVRADHLRFWAAAPEPVYLAVYIEAADEFIAEDVRDIVERQWPANAFYSAVPESQQQVTVHVDAHQRLDGARIAAMLAHRSMRIDGPPFRGRPLGHRYDPLRSTLAPPPRDVFDRLVTRLLADHDFRPGGEAITVALDLTAVHGRFYETLEWQSPAFSEYGRSPYDDLRDEPPVEFLHGSVTVFIDPQPARVSLADPDQDRISQLLLGQDALLRTPEEPLLAIFNARDLSGTGGLWRNLVRDLAGSGVPFARHIGLEALSSLVLVAPLVYMDFAPELAWEHVNYR